MISANYTQMFQKKIRINAYIIILHIKYILDMHIYLYVPTYGDTHGKN
jgi:hypothetical protein